MRGRGHGDFRGDCSSFVAIAGNFVAIAEDIVAVTSVFMAIAEVLSLKALARIRNLDKAQ